MKSRTSFFNPTIYRKNLTRFAPVWALYCLGLLMTLTVIVDLNTDYIRSLNMADMLNVFAIVHLGYGLVVAQLLFGDLYNPRLCNALHAMPLRRECWFWTNVTSGLTFGLVPTAVFALLVMPFLGGGWSLAVWFLLGTTLEYLFFFGVAVFSIMLAGNRFAQVLVYGLINFLSVLFYWFAATLYEPLMYGVSINADAFLRWCPTYSMVECELVNVIRTELVMADGRVDLPGTVDAVVLNGDWWYPILCAVIGIGLTVAALALYRRRHLESAGDFMAVKAVEPVFLVLFTLGVGAFFQLFGRLFENPLEYLFLALGLVVGFFAGRMLLMRTTRVFQPKALRGLGAIAAALVLSIILIAVDAFGIVRHVPDREDVNSVSFGNNYHYGGYRDFSVSDQADIEKLLDIHEYATQNIPEHWDPYGGYFSYFDGTYYTNLYLTYELHDGSYLERNYYIPVDSEPGRILKEYYTSIDYVLGVSESELPRLAGSVNALYVEGNGYNYEALEAMGIQGLLDAIAADCRAGTMIQDWSYHGDEESRSYIEIEFRYTDDRYDWRGLYVYDNCVNTLTWLAENGFQLSDAKYGV